MSTNEKYRRGGGVVRRLAVASGVVSGDPVEIGFIHGIAETTRDSDGYASVYLPFNAIYEFAVEAKDGAGNSAVAIGDKLFYDVAETIKLNKDATNGKFYGYALEAITAGSNDTIEVGMSDGVAGEGVPVASALAANGAVAVPSRDTTFVITKAGVAALTLVDPTSGTHDGLKLTFISATANAHTLSNAAGSGFNAGGAGSDIGTFGGAIGDGIMLVAYGGKWLVITKTNVTLA